MRELKSIRKKLSLPPESDQVADEEGVAGEEGVADEEGVANQRAREFAVDFSHSRKQPALSALGATKPRTLSRHNPHRKVLQTRRISGDLPPIAKSRSELTGVSLRFRNSKRVRLAGFEPATYGLGIRCSIP